MNFSNTVGSLALGNWSSMETVSSALAIAFSTLLKASASLSVLLPLLHFLVVSSIFGFTSSFWTLIADVRGGVGV